MIGADRSLRSVVPGPLRERGRLWAAAILESRQRRTASVRGAALVFHAVATTEGRRDLEVDPALSAARLGDIAGYLSERYRLVQAGDLAPAARARRPGERIPVAITFDDDLPSHREQAAPALARHGAIATAFLCEPDGPFWWQTLQVAIDERAIDPTDLPGVSEELLADALARVPRAIRRLAQAIEELPPSSRAAVAATLEAAAPSRPEVLGAEGAAALAAQGWELGFHTTRHELVTALEPAELAAALERRPSRATGELPRTLAYPHGKAGPREAEAARQAGYSAAFTGYASVLTEGTDDHLIGRLQPPTSTIGRFALGLARALAGGRAA